MKISIQFTDLGLQCEPGEYPGLRRQFTSMKDACEWGAEQVNKYHGRFSITLSDSYDGELGSFFEEQLDRDL